MSKEKQWIGTVGRIKAAAHLLENQDQGQSWDKLKRYVIRDMEYKIHVAKCDFD